MNENKVTRFVAVAILVTVLEVSAFGQEVGREIGMVSNGSRVDRSSAEPQRSFYEQIIDPVDGLNADDFVRYALARNGELAAARQLIAEAHGRLRQAGLRSNPIIEASGAHAITNADNNLKMEAELPLELGGRRNARIEVAQREIELRQAEVADFERKLAAEVRLKYSQAISAARNLKFNEDLLTLTHDSFRIVQARVERGKSAPLEQNLLTVELNRADVMRIGLESKAEVAILELKKVAGLVPTEPVRLKGEFRSDRQPATASEALTQALANRPDLVAARAAERLAESQIGQARVGGKVDASIFAGYLRQRMGFGVFGFDDAGRPSPVDAVFNYATFGVRLSLPVRNKNQGNIDAAISAVEAAHRRREFAETVVRNEVAAAYARYQRAQAALDLFRSGVREQALRNVEVIRQTYVLGQKTVLDYLGEQRRFVDIETVYTDVLREYFESLVEIERAAASPLPSA